MVLGTLRASYTEKNRTLQLTMTIGHDAKGGPVLTLWCLARSDARRLACQACARHSEMRCEIVAVRGQ